MLGTSFVIDSHSHIGLSSLSGNNNSEAYLIEQMDKRGVDAGIVLPHAQQDLETVASTHSKIGQMMKDYPKRIFGMASLNPRLGSVIYHDEIRRCVEEFGFCGIKYEPQIHALHIDSKAAQIVFDCAREFNIPVLIHTSPGTFSTPVFILETAERYSDVTIVMAHSGMISYFKEALFVAKRCPNVMFESSWSTVMNVLSVVQELGSERIMFGSDHPFNIPVEFAKIDALDLSPKDRDNILGNTAKRIYGLPV